jgi:hypothetical protein
MSGYAEGLRQLCHDLNNQTTVSEAYDHLNDIADAASYVEQIAQRLSQQISSLAGEAAIAVDNLPSSFARPVEDTISHLSDACSQAHVLHNALYLAVQAASHLYTTETAVT